MHAGGFVQARRERLREHRNRAAHQHRRRRDQQDRQADVEGEGEALAEVRDADGERLGQAEEEREEQGVDPDARLHQAVEAQQLRRLAAPAGPLDELLVMRPNSA